MRGFVTGSAILALCLCATTAFAGGGDPNYILTCSFASGAPGDAIGTTASLDSQNGAVVQGWSFGMCSDPAILQVDGAAVNPAAAGLNDPGGIGTALGFANVQLFPNGAACGVVIDLFGVNSLPPTGNTDLFDVDYTIVGTTSTQINFCETLGAVPVTIVIVVAGGSIPPVNIPCDVEVTCEVLSADSTQGLLGTTVDSTITLENCAGAGPVDGVSIALTYSPAVIEVNSVGNTVGADFIDSSSGGGELVIGIIMDTSSPLDNQIPAGQSTTDVVTVTWDAIGVGVSALAFTDGIGTPAINNGVVHGTGGFTAASTSDGSVTVVNFNTFLRGDCNHDVIVNIADGVFELNFLFQGGPSPFCDDACDSNDDSSIEVADAIYIFNYQFLDGPAPLAPFPTADIDATTGDGLGCNNDADS